MTTIRMEGTTPPPRGSADPPVEVTQVFPTSGCTLRPEDLSVPELVDLLRDEQRERWRQGERVLVEEYLQRHPQLQGSAEALTLIYDEFLIRQHLGEEPSLTDYQRRFPNLAAHLQERFNQRLERDSSFSLGQLEPPPGRGRRTADPLPAVRGYEILSELGRGGMGVVYKARQLGLNRIVALKMVLGGPFADADFQARFQTEAEAVARLQHPNIVQIFASGIEESPLGQAFSCPYFSQEYVSGGNLAARLARSPQPPKAVARFIEILARAIHYAHERGIVHRDLKPANILLEASARAAPTTEDPSKEYGLQTTDYGLPKITDFGLAKQVDRTAGSPTITGTLLGTPEYMAPEQAGCEATVSPAVDIYALGVILYEMLTGRRPFEAATPLDVIEQVRMTEPVPPRRLQPRTPRDLDTICLTCLQKEPARRYPSALAMAEDLERFLAGEPIRARPVSLPERTWRWARRRPALASLALFACLLTIGSGIALTIAWRYAAAGWSEADARRTEAELHQERAERGREISENNLYFSRIVQADLARRLDNPLTAGRLLDLCAPRADVDQDRRGWEWHYLQGILHPDLLTLPAPHEVSVTDLAFSQDGKRLMTAGGSPFNPLPSDRIRIWDVEGPTAGMCVKEFPHQRRAISAVWGEGDQYIVWANSEGRVETGDITTGEVRLLRQLPEKAHGVRFSRAGRLYATLKENEAWHVWEQGKDTSSVTSSASRVRSVTPNPDGTLLAVEADGQMSLWDIATNTNVRDLAMDMHHLHGSGRPAFSADGRMLALGSQTGQIHLWDVASGRLIQTLAGHSGSVLSVAFRPDGRQLATGGADHTVRVWDIQSGAELQLLRGCQGRVSALAFHPAGSYLASGSEQPAEVRIWDLTRPQEYLNIPERGVAQRRVEAMSFSGDGSLVQIARVIGLIQRTRTDTGLDEKPVKVDLRGEWIVPSCLARFSADGRRLAAVSQTSPQLVKLLDASTGAELQRFKHPRAVVQLGLARDGRRLATSATAWRGTRQREVFVWDTETGEQLAAIPCERSPITHLHGPVALNNDGTLLAYDEHFPAEPGTSKRPIAYVCLRDLQSGATRRITRGWSHFLEQLTFDPTGRYLATVSSNDGVSVYDCQEDRWLHSAPLDDSSENEISEVAFSPDGSRLAGVNRVEVILWDAVSGQKLLVLHGAPPRPSDNGYNPRVAWSPDGQQLAVSNWNNSVSIWSAADRASPAAKEKLRQAAAARAAKP